MPGSCDMEGERGDAMATKAAVASYFFEFDFDEEWTCPVCWELLYKPTVNLCGHLFCFWCAALVLSLVHRLLLPVRVFRLQQYRLVMGSRKGGWCAAQVHPQGPEPIRALQLPLLPRVLRPLPRGAPDASSPPCLCPTSQG